MQEVETTTKASILQRLCAALFNPVDISFLVAFRILFGGIMLWEVYRYFTHGWIARYFVEPAVTFSYYGFSWVKPWPGRGTDRIQAKLRNFRDKIYGSAFAASRTCSG